MDEAIPVEDIFEEACALPNGELRRLCDMLWRELKGRRQQNDLRQVASLQPGDKVRSLVSCTSRGAVLRKGGIGVVVDCARTRVGIDFDGKKWQLHGNSVERVDGEERPNHSQSLATY